MACTTFLLQPLATTKQFSRIPSHRNIFAWQLDQNGDHYPLRMNWVVVADKNGIRRLRMLWTQHMS
jgi:hypothetical protein